MKNISTEQVFKLRNEGKSTYEISKILDVSQTNIFYHLNKDKVRQRKKEYYKKLSPEQKKKLTKKRKENYNKLSLEQRKKIYQRNKEYLKNYQKERYKNDPEFRQKKIERAKEYNGKKNTNNSPIR